MSVLGLYVQRGRCFFCDHETAEGGEWCGQDAKGEVCVIVVCPRCIDHLGQLAADTWEGSSCWRNSSDREGLRQLERGYWYGLTCARRTKRWFGEVR